MTPLGQQRLNLVLMFIAGVVGIIDVSGIWHGTNAHTYATIANGVIMLAVGSLPKWWGVPVAGKQS